jgi:hypothetical protein
MGELVFTLIYQFKNESLKISVLKRELHKNNENSVESYLFKK